MLTCLFKRKSQSTFLYLELTSGGVCVTLPVISFPLCPSYWEIQPPLTTQKLSVGKFPRAKILVDLTGFNGTNKLSRQSLAVTNLVWVGPFN